MTESDNSMKFYMWYQWVVTRGLLCAKHMMWQWVKWGCDIIPPLRFVFQTNWIVPKIGLSSINRHSQLFVCGLWTFLWLCFLGCTWGASCKVTPSESLCIFPTDWWILTPIEVSMDGGLCTRLVLMSDIAQLSVPPDGPQTCLWILTP